MGSSKEKWFACENGHAVLAGSTVCTECGAQVTTKRVKVANSAETAARTRALALTSVGLGTVLTAGVAFFIFALAEGEVEPSPTPSASAVSLTCEGVGTEIELGIEVEDAPQVSCFTVDADSVVLVGAASSEGEVLNIEIERADGAFWAAARGGEGFDPEIAAFFLPGAYIVTVTTKEGSAPGGFTLVTQAGDPDDPTGGPDPTLPGLDECGSSEAPLIELSEGVAELASDGTVVHACLRLDEAAFVKVGAEVGEGNAADLNLALYSFDDAGRPVFIRSVLDTFGLDPEMSLDLDVGMYLVEVNEWMDAPVGDYTLYAATDPEYFRTGEVSAELAGLSVADCNSGDIPTVRIDDSVVFTTNEPLACLTVPETQRLTLKAISFGGQDLTLEVIGFTDDGTPFRFVWVDDDLWATDFEDYDPRLDTILPAGLYVLAAADFYGEATHDLMIAVDTSNE